MPFERRGYVVGHRVGTGAGVRRLHLDHGIVDGREVVHREPEITQRSEEDSRDGQHYGHHRPANEGFRKVHTFPSCGRFPGSAGIHACLLRSVGSRRNAAGMDACAPRTTLFFERSAPLGCSTKTLPPGVTPIWPLTTTFSPGAIPFSMTTISPCLCPTVTGRISAVESSLTT